LMVITIPDIWKNYSRKDFSTFFNNITSTAFITLME
jgi:hypothetical protein